MSYDIVGDIHGHFDELVLLIEKLGYIQKNNLYVHPDNRKLIFVGDLIDRGPKIREVLQLVKGLVDNDLGYCILGNHEYNAVNFWQLRKDGKGYYRKHNHTNLVQHYQTIMAFKNKEEEWNMYLDWMITLPFILEMENFRVVHAVYHPLTQKLLENMKTINKNVKIQNKTIVEVSREKENVNWTIDDESIHSIVETTLKGIQVPLDNGLTFQDKEGTIRNKARIKWWLDPKNNTYDKYLEPYAGERPELKDVPVNIDLVDKNFINSYPKEEKPVFFGHYWLKMNGEPELQGSNICCLDYSVAKQGHLVAYRFDGEKELDSKKFVYVKTVKN